MKDVTRYISITATKAQKMLKNKKGLVIIFTVINPFGFRDDQPHHLV